MPSLDTTATGRESPESSRHQKIAARAKKYHDEHDDDGDDGKRVMLRPRGDRESGRETERDQHRHRNYDNNDKYGGSRRDHDRRARDQSDDQDESEDGSSRALVRHGGESQALTKKPVYGDEDDDDDHRSVSKRATGTY